MCMQFQDVGHGIQACKKVGHWWEGARKRQVRQGLAYVSSHESIKHWRSKSKGGQTMSITDGQIK